MILLILPYLFAAVRRLEARGLPTFEGALIGFAAAIGFSLKPQYLTVAAGIEALLIYRARDLHHLIRLELVALVLGGAMYCAAVWIITPDYITTVIPIDAEVYGYWNHQTLLKMMNSRDALAIILAAAIALILQRGSDLERLATSFMIAGTGAFVSFLLQAKGWSNHRLPSEIFIILSLGVSVIGHFLRWMNRRGAPNAGRNTLNVAAIVSGLVMIGISYPVRVGILEKSWPEELIAEVNRATAGFPAGTPFLLLPDGVSPIFNLVIDRGFVWASRYPYLLLPSEIVQHASGLASPRGHTGDKHAVSYVWMLRADVVKDFQRWHPKIVLIQRCTQAISQGFAPLCNVIEWLSVDSTFALIWSNYSWFKQIGAYDLYLYDGKSG